MFMINHQREIQSQLQTSQTETEGNNGIDQIMTKKP